MGLDISVYSNVTPLEKQPQNGEDPKYPDHYPDWAYEQASFLSYAHGSQAQSLRGLEQETWYVGEYETGFRAGSYGGYNAWRNELSLRALGVPAETVWNNLDAYRDKPFFELINFSDCEGTIGSEAAADLYVDFQTEQERVLAPTGNADMDEFFAEKYMDWKDACQRAGTEHGAIVFH